MEKIKLNDLKVFEVDVWVGAAQFDVYLVSAEDAGTAQQQALKACPYHEVIDVTVQLLK